MSIVRLTTVVTAAADQLLVTLANAKADLGITSSDDDAYLTRLIAQCSDDIARYCGRVFKSETVDDTFYLSASQKVLILQRYPTASISSVTVDGVALSSTYYTFDPATGIVYRLDDNLKVIDWSYDKVVIRYAGGYTSIPTSLEAACVAYVKARKAARDRDPALRAEKIPEVYEAQYWVSGKGEGNIPADVAGMLSPFMAYNV
jgi:hypothetical protein